MLFADFETFSECNLKLCGGAVYARHPTTEALIMAYAFDNDDVQIWDATGEPMPVEIDEYLTGEGDICFHNSAFDRGILEHVLNYHPNISRYKDTMVMAYRRGYIGGLKDLGKALGLSAEHRKQAADGWRLIHKFCVPRKPTKNDPSVRVMPSDAPEEWLKFKEYAEHDVIAMRECYRRLM